MMQNITTPFDFSIEIESLYIAHVFPNINKKRIAQLFEKLNLARISGIDFVSKIGKDGKPYNSAYIHIDYWFDNASARHFQEKIRSDAKESLLVYDDPWYWIVNENISSKKSLFIQNTEYENQLAALSAATASASALASASHAETEIEEDLIDHYQDEEEYQFLQYEAVCQEIDEMEVEEENNFLKEIKASEINDSSIECYKMLFEADKRIRALLYENKRLKHELRKNICGY
jgi:hypothetical protein